MKTYTAVIERCPETRLFVGYIPGFPGAHTQGGDIGRAGSKLDGSRVHAFGGRRAAIGGRICRHPNHPGRLSMGNVPVLKPREVEQILRQLGFDLARQRGSHRQYRHPDGRGTTVPFHAGRDLSPLLLRQIAKDVGLTVEQFLGKR
jgi:predicted RNA binding protein YcfA (HicA-like mRNA interferase family)